MPIPLSNALLLQFLCLKVLSIFKKKGRSNRQNSLLDNSELLTLRTLAEQLDCSPSPKLTLDSRSAGSLPTRTLGSGIDYAESRIYQQGDDPRSINWRLSARSQETFVKVYHIEARPSLSLLLDQRRSMIFGTQQRLKITQALRVASLLTYASQLHQLDFKAWILNDNSLRQFNEGDSFLFEANKACPLSYKSNQANNLNDLNSALQEVVEKTPSGALAYIISDFSGINQQTTLAQLHEKCFTQAIHILDRAELELPPIGKLHLQNMYQNKSYQINTYKKKDRSLSSQKLNEIVDIRKTTINNLGITYNKIFTETDNIHDYIALPLGYS